MLQAVEYIWLDGVKPTQQIRAKSRILNLPEEAELTDFPIWSFDGSSTSQANSKGSDCYLRPVCLSFTHLKMAMRFCGGLGRKWEYSRKQSACEIKKSARSVSTRRSVAGF